MNKGKVLVSGEGRAWKRQPGEREGAGGRICEIFLLGTGKGGGGIFI